MKYNNFELWLLTAANFFQVFRVQWWAWFNKDKIAVFYHYYRLGMTFDYSYKMAKEYKCEQS